MKTAYIWVEVFGLKSNLPTVQIRAAYYRPTKPDPDAGWLLAQTVCYPGDVDEKLRDLLISVTDFLRSSGVEVTVFGEGTYKSMTDQKPFPTRQSVEEQPPACYSCLRPTDPTTVRESGFAKGAGGYVVSCSKCDYMTWFDVEEAK